MKRISVLFSVLIFLFVCTSVATAVPKVINYQGKLTDPGGTQVNRTVQMTFTLYDALSGGEELWSEVQDVTVENGIFNVRLGESTPLDVSLFDHDDLYLEVAVLNSDTESEEILSPRQAITSTAFAMKAGNAESLNGQDASHFDQSAHVLDTENPHHVTAAQTGAVALQDFTWDNLEGIPSGFADKIDNVGLTSESDPTVLESVKDGVSWDEIQNRPETVGDITAVNAGTGLTGGGGSGDVTLDVRVPLNLTGAESTSALDMDWQASAIVSGVNTATPFFGMSTGGYFKTQSTYGSAVRAETAGDSSQAVYGLATSEADVTNYGGFFLARGEQARAVYGEASSPGTDIKENFGGFFKAAGYKGKGVHGEASGALGIGVEGTAQGTGVYGHATGDDSGYGGWGGHFVSDGIDGTGAVASGKKEGIYGTSEQTGVHGSAVNSASSGSTYGGYFEAQGQSSTGVYGQGSTGVEGHGTSYDFYASGSGANYAPFTGAHEIKLADDVPENVKPGMIMSVTGETQVRIDKTGKVSISSTLPTVSLSVKPNDRAVFGVFVVGTRLMDGHWYRKTAGDRFGMVNALGEGRVWVTDLNGPIEPGDYITTSDMPGYGQKQNDDLLHSYTVGKAIEKVDWENVEDTVEFNGRIVKMYLIAVVYTSG